MVSGKATILKQGFLTEAEQHTGVMVAFFIDANNAAQLAIPDGEPAKDMHVTLAFLGDASELGITAIETVKNTLATFAANNPPLQGEISGVGRFTSVPDDQPTPVYASVDVPHLNEWRARLVQALMDSGVSPDNTHGYTPHSTLAYIPKDAPMPVTSVPALQLTFNQVWLAVGEERYSFSLDMTEEVQAQESLVESEPFAPKARIAQLKVKFLTDGAISKNGRQYPQQTVTQLINSGQDAINNGHIVNACISHNASDMQEDNPLVVSGKASRIWREGSDAYAMFDIPDTSTGRDMVALISGGYIPPTMSLRASGATMKVERGKSVPQVTGDVMLNGIDFTSVPGIEIARIQHIVMESTAEPQSVVDVFDCLETILVDEQEDARMSKAKSTAEETASPATSDISEGAGNVPVGSLASGDSQSTDGTATDNYASRVYPKVGAKIPDVDVFKSSMEESVTTHNHMASALGMPCAPGGGTTESRRVTKTMESHMVAVHDLHAKKLGMACEGSYQSQQATNNQQGNDDKDTNMESAVQASQPTTPVKESKKMTPEEAMALLKESGYTVAAPKTEAEKLQEAFEAKLEEQRVKFEASQAALLEQVTKAVATSQPAATRTTLVENTNATRETRADSPRAKRSRVQENLMSADWQRLADRSEPLPEGVTQEAILEHFGRVMVLDFGDRYGYKSVQPANS